MHKLALHIAGLEFERRDFDRTNFWAEPDINEEGRVDGVANTWFSTPAGAFMRVLGRTNPNERFLIALWNKGEGKVRVESGGIDADLDEWVEPVWHPAAPNTIPPLFARNELRSGVSIVLLGEGDDDDTAYPADGGERSLRWVAHALDRCVFDSPLSLDVDAEMPTLDGPDERWATDFYVVRGQRELLDLMAAPGGHGSGGAEDRFDWWILRDDADLSWVAGNLCVVDGTLITAALGPGEEMRELMRRMGVEAGFERVVIVDYHHRHGGWAEAAEDFRANLPEPLAERNRELQARLRRVGEDELQLRLEDLEEFWAMLSATPATTASGEGATGDPYLLAYTADQPPLVAPERKVPRVWWLSQAAGTRAEGRLEGLAAEYLPDSNTLEINADFPLFTTLTKYWTETYARSRGLMTKPIWNDETKEFVEAPELVELRETIDEVVREWCEQSLGEVCAGAHAFAESQLWDQAQLAAVLSPSALTAASLSIYHTQQAIKRSLGQRLGSLKKEKTV